jgi:hypothetical protein
MGCEADRKEVRRMQYLILDMMLEDVGDGWKQTDLVSLANGEAVKDPTRPGRFVYGPAHVQLIVPPDGAHMLHVED